MKAFIDQHMDTGVAAAIVLVHIVALIWAAALRKGMTPLLVVNLLLPAAVLAYNAGRLGALIEYADTAPLALTAYAAAAFICSACVLGGLRILAWINWIVFAINSSLSVLLLAFLITFKMTRLF